MTAHYQRTLIACIGFLLIAMCGCEKTTETQSADASNAQSGQGQSIRHIKVQVSAAGDIRVDGTPTSIEQLEARIAKLSSEDIGALWYYREEPLKDPHPNAIRVINMAAQHGLSISMSSKPDFSDYIDEEGYSRPRK